MNQVVAKAIVLKRLDFQEAARIVTFLTRGHGKITLIAKGVRRSKSKLASGIELFSISDITYIPAKKDIGTLVSARLETHFGNIVTDINRTMFAYEALKKIHKITEDEVDEEYFALLAGTMQALDSAQIPQVVTEVWFYVRLLQLTGHGINSHGDNKGSTLVAGQNYLFSYDDMAFYQHPDGSFDDKHIKVMRLASTHSPQALSKVGGVNELCQDLRPLVVQASALIH
jgi:DNA repair protein RecO